MTSESELRPALDREWQWCGLDGPPEWVALLGHGESYDAWHVATRRVDVVVRTARREAADLPRGLRAEWETLRRLPEGIGPRPVALDETGERIGVPAMVVSLVAGEMPLDPAVWDQALIDRFAALLAGLHAQAYERCGPLDDPTRTAVSIVGAFEAGLGWWIEHHPEVVDDAELLALLPAVRSFLAEREPWFEGVRRFALVHGDLVAANVLVDEGEPRLVDWEWAEVDDVARDLGLLGGTLAREDVQVPLARGQVEALVRAYLTVAPRDVHAAETEESLLARRDAWEVHEAVLAGLHDRLLVREGREELDDDGESLTRRRIRETTRALGDLCRGDRPGSA